MSKVDKALHFLGLAAAGLITTVATGGYALPAWLKILAGTLAFAAPASAASLVKKTEPPKTP